MKKTSYVQSSKVKRIRAKMCEIVQKEVIFTFSILITPIYSDKFDKVMFRIIKLSLLLPVVYWTTKARWEGVGVRGTYCNYNSFDIH